MSMQVFCVRVRFLKLSYRAVRDKGRDCGRNLGSSWKKNDILWGKSSQFQSRDQDDFVAGLFNSSAEELLLRDTDIFGPTGQQDEDFGGFMIDIPEYTSQYGE